MKISIFGTGYVGLVTGACLANLGQEVRCIDVDEEKINLIKTGTIPFFEPGLKERDGQNMVRGRLNFTSDLKQGVEFGEVIFNCVGTPGNRDGSANLDYVFSVAEIVGRYATGYKVLVNKSTVPPGTARKCSEVINKVRGQLNNQASFSSSIEIVSNPEFLKEGSAIYDFTHPDKIIIGTPSDKAYSIVEQVYYGLIRQSKPLKTDWETAEIIKYANNSFLAAKISLINEIANICDLIGADIKVVAKAIGMDYRISPKFLNAGIGYAGSCFPKDIRALVNLAAKRGYEAKLLQEIDLFNERQKKMLLSKLKTKFPNLKDKTVALWGLSFKPKTSDIREAVSLVLIDELLAHGAKVNVYDPIANDEVRKVKGNRINYCSSAYESARDSSAVILVTEWDEFRTVDFSQIGGIMAHKVIFDGRNIYDSKLLKNLGFEYYGVGRS